MRDLWKIFKHSTALPKRQAAFQLNRIGMDKIIFYLFALLAIASIPELIDQISQNEVSSALYMKTFFFLIFFFIFYYLTLVVIMLTALSGIAYIGSLIATRTKRKVRYSILWKMAACITTIPILLFTAISFFYPLSAAFLGVMLAYHLLIFVQTILIYPKRRKRKS